jgi:nucleoside-diphosphate-sugar epimerase
LDWTIVRPNAFMELWAGILGDPIVKSGKTTVFGRGDNPINFNSVRDVARFVELALFDSSLSRTVLEVGGPENVSLNQLVRQVEEVAGRKAVVKHLPHPVMWFSRMLMRPFKPDIAALIEAGIAMDAMDMTFDAIDLRRRFPQVTPNSVADVLRQQVSASNLAASTPYSATDPPEPGGDRDGFPTTSCSSLEAWSWIDKAK